LVPEVEKIDFSKLEQYSLPSWRVKTPDGNEYGPFAKEQIVQFADEGRITRTTSVANDEVTKGKFVPAVKFPDLLKRIEAKESAQAREPIASPPVVESPTSYVEVSKVASSAIHVAKDRLTKFSSKRSVLVMAAHGLSVGYLLLGLVLVAWLGLSEASGALHWLSVGAMPFPRFQEGSGALVVIPMVAVRFAFAPVALSIMAEILHCVACVRRSQSVS
jgi:hypothetical protein